MSKGVNAMLSTSELAQICTIPASTLTAWVSHGVIKPTVKGTCGKRNGHRYDLMKSVGIAVATCIYQGEQGCTLAYVKRVVRCFKRITAEELAARLEGGSIYFVFPLKGGPLLSRRKVRERVNVNEVLQQIESALATTDMRLAEVAKSR